MMQNDSRTPVSPGRTLDAIGGFFVGLGTRLLVHLSSLVAAAILASTTVLPQTFSVSTASLVFCIYVGLICLVPRGIAKTPEWLIPTGCGTLLIILWGLSGVPWQFCIIWGGILTFCIRLLNRRGRMDWEWAVLPWLLIGLYCFFSSLLPLSPVTPPYISFALLALAGWGALRLCARMRGDTEQKLRLVAACGIMEALLAEHALHEDLEQPLERLVRLSRRLLELKPRLDKDSLAISQEVVKTADTLRSRGGSLTPAEAAEARLTAEKLNRDVELYVRSLEPEPASQSGEGRALAERLEGYRAQASALEAKAAPLPASLQAHIRGIARATESITFCMRDDPGDVPAGDRFLSRYLKAAHTVTDEHTRLLAQGGVNTSLDTALARSAELFGRLEKAFTDEHAALLSNDAMNFTAELNVLDKLLKMEGK